MTPIDKTALYAFGQIHALMHARMYEPTTHAQTYMHALSQK